MKNHIVLFLSLFFSLSYSQTDILDGYPPEQFFYDKGELNFLKQLQEVALKNAVQPCANKNEEYLVKFIVFPDSEIKFVRDPDTLAIAKNKCAFDFSRQTFKFLDGWKPVMHQGKPYAALAEYKIIPNEILMYEINADLQPVFKEAGYRGGKAAFSMQLEKLIQPIFDKYRLQIGNTSLLVSFIVAKDGSMQNINLSHPLFFRVKDEVLEAFKTLRKWKPATKNGVPVEQKANMRIRFEL